MIEKSSAVGGGLGEGLPRSISRPPTPVEPQRHSRLCSLRARHQRAAQPVAGLLHRDQENLDLATPLARRRRSACGSCRVVHDAARAGLDPDHEQFRAGRPQPRSPGGSATKASSLQPRRSRQGPPLAAPSTVCGPMVGRSMRWSWPSLAAFTSTPVPAGVGIRPTRAQLCDPRQHAVGALGGLDGEHVTGGDHRPLPDVVRPDRAQQAEPAFDVGKVLRRSARGSPTLPAGIRICGCDLVRADDAKPAILEDAHDTRQQVIVAAAIDAPRPAAAGWNISQSTRSARQRRPDRRADERDVAAALGPGVAQEAARPARPRASNAGYPSRPARRRPSRGSETARRGGRRG